MTKAIVLGLLVALLVFSGVEWAMRWSRRRGKLRAPMLVGSLTLAIVAGLAGPAFAASSQNTGFTYRSTFECTENHVYISDTTGKPHLDSWVKNWKYDTEYSDCIDYNGASTASVAAGLLKVNQDLLHWNGSSWVFCSIGAYYYNSTNTYERSTSYNFTYTCGHGYYYGETEGYVYNGQWNGGLLATPNYVNLP